MKGSTVLFSKVPPRITEYQLKALFETCGPVSDLKLEINRETGESLGIGYVQYELAESAKAAMFAFINIHFDNQWMVLNIAWDK